MFRSQESRQPYGQNIKEEHNDEIQNNFYPVGWNNADRANIGRAGTPGTPVRDETYNPTISPADFTRTINNPYLPLMPGTTFIYEGMTEDGRVKREISVTHDTKAILGVTCIVVRDKAWIDDELEEDTFDWYVQDTDGNVWYFGEDTKKFEAGKVVSTEGSWEAGVDEAKPGIVMQAQPQIGAPYRLSAPCHGVFEWFPIKRR